MDPVTAGRLGPPGGFGKGRNEFLNILGADFVAPGRGQTFKIRDHEGRLAG